MSSIENAHIALLVSPRGTEEPEFTSPREALTGAGASVTVVSTESGEAETVNNDLDPGGAYPIDVAIDAVSTADFDAVVIPGGTVGADTLRASNAVVDFVKAMSSAAKTVAAICHAPWVLIEAGLVDGARLTSFPSLATDIRNAGGTWLDQEVVRDGNLITSRNPDDLPAFNEALVSAYSTA